MNQERRRAAVVGRNPESRIELGIRTVCRASEQFRGAMNDGQDQVRIVVRKFALEHGRNALEAHAGIDGGPGQRSQLAGCIPIVLHEHQVPDFHVASAGIAGEGLIGAARIGSLRTQVVMNL